MRVNSLHVGVQGEKNDTGLSTHFIIGFINSLTFVVIFFKTFLSLH